MRTSPVLAYVPLFLIGCGESSIQSSPSTASQDTAPHPPTPLVVDDDPKSADPRVIFEQEISRLRIRLSSKQWQRLTPKQLQTLHEDFRKALDELLPHDPWLGSPGRDIPGPNYDRWDMHPDRDSRGRRTPKSVSAGA